MVPFFNFSNKKKLSTPHILFVLYYTCLSIYILKNNKTWFLTYLWIRTKHKWSSNTSFSLSKDCSSRPCWLCKFVDHYSKEPECHGEPWDRWQSPALGFTSSLGTSAMRTLQMMQSVLWRQKMESSLPVGQELRVFSAEGAGSRPGSARRALRSIPWGSPLCSSSRSTPAATQDGRIGEGCWKEESAHLPCTDVGGFCSGSVLFLFVSGVFFYSLQDTVTHIFVTFQDTVSDACGQEEPLGRDS